MKKYLSLMLVGIMSLGLVACGGGGGDSTTKEDATPAPATQAAAPTDAPADVVEVPDANGDMLVVGFAQIGQESGWRDAETNSIKAEAEVRKDTVKLNFADAQQQQQNQIKAIRTFIEQGVDVIGLAPVEITGWEAVFQEAKDAGIPIVLVDRGVDDAISEDLYATFIGSDFIEEGKNAAIEMSRLLDGEGKIVELQGSVGASAAIERQKGFVDEIAANHPGIEIIDSQTGNFERSGGKEVMEAFLKSNPDIDGVYAHNDDMVLGAIEAIKDAGKKPGEDIKTVSIDGVGDVFLAMIAGEANVTVECNPNLGPQFFDVCQRLKNGETVERWIKSNEGIFRSETAAEDYPTRTY